MRLTDSEAFELLLINYLNNPETSSQAKYVLSVVLDMAKANPTIDAVKVVRCKDCCFWDKQTSRNMLWWTEAVCKHFSIDGISSHKMWTQTNWFCADGERREDNG